MRTHLYRGVLALAVALVFAAPAFAQGIVKGKVVDDKNQPVADAKVTITGPARNAETKTNNKGEYVQVGLQSGAYTVTVQKDKVGQAAAKVTVSQGTPVEQNFTLTATSGITLGGQTVQGNGTLAPPVSTPVTVSGSTLTVTVAAGSTAIITLG